MYVHVHIHIYIHTHTRIYICTYIYTYIYIDIVKYIHVYFCVRLRVCACEGPVARALHVSGDEKFSKVSALLYFYYVKCLVNWLQRNSTSGPLARASKEGAGGVGQSQLKTCPDSGVTRPPLPLSESPSSSVRACPSSVKVEKLAWLLLLRICLAVFRVVKDPTYNWTKLMM